MPSRQEQRVGLSQALFIVSCLFCCASPMTLAADTGLTQRVTRLEQCAFGTSHRERPLEPRLEALELKTLGHRQSGNLAGRLAGLERVVGVESATNMPPVAPVIEAHNTFAAGQTNSTDDLYAAAPNGSYQHSASSILRGSATEYGATRPALSPVNNPFTAPLMPGHQPDYGNASVNAYAGGAQHLQVAGNAGQTSAHRRISPVVRTMVLNKGLSALSRVTPGAGGLALQALHCPLCRLLQH